MIVLWFKPEIFMGVTHCIIAAGGGHPTIFIFCSHIHDDVSIVDCHLQCSLFVQFLLYIYIFLLSYFFGEFHIVAEIQNKYLFILTLPVA